MKRDFSSKILSLYGEINTNFTISESPISNEEVYTPKVLKVYFY